MKRGFEDLRKKIIVSLNKKPMTKMELSRELNADYRTIERHIIWLKGSDKIKEKLKNKKIYYAIK